MNEKTWLHKFYATPADKITGIYRRSLAVLLKAQIEALELSIKKWIGYSRDETGEYWHADHCALCQRYFEEVESDNPSKLNCHHCPLEELVPASCYGERCAWKEKNKDGGKKMIAALKKTLRWTRLRLRIVLGKNCDIHDLRFKLRQAHYHAK